LLSVVRSVLVAVSISLTCAAFTVAPCGSLTCPDTVPAEEDCPHAQELTAATAHTKNFPNPDHRKGFADTKIINSLESYSTVSINFSKYSKACQILGLQITSKLIGYPT
jgi:hypothetical protein